jgi:hypothetical protein
MIHGGARHARISVWAGFYALGLTRIHVIEGNLDSTKLIGIFSAELIQYARRTWPIKLLQDNSPIQFSKVLPRPQSNGESMGIFEAGGREGFPYQHRRVN